jgi:16S rRNA (uracil1498-N3)-methyltransferase
VTAAGLAASGAVAHVFVLDVETPVLAEDDAHHLFRVRRLRRGELVTVGDGAGRWRICRVVDASGLEPEGPVVTEPRPEPPVTVAFALTKGARPEWTVQKLTEAGVDTIIPMAADRSVVRWDHADALRHHARLVRIATEAAMQSRRAWLPAVAPLTTFSAAVADLEFTAALAAADGGPPTLARPAVLIGPEGGWSDGELACSLPRVGLGPHVLRAEMAAIAAGVLLIGIRCAVVGPMA